MTRCCYYGNRGEAKVVSTAHWEPTGNQTAEFCFHNGYRTRGKENLKQKEK